MSSLRSQILDCPNPLELSPGCLTLLLLGRGAGWLGEGVLCLQTITKRSRSMIQSHTWNSFGRMLMAAATVRPPAESPHRHRRPGLVYPSCRLRQR